ncbi:hypothetical protein EON66_04595 [archaeon]|nr:MAG: hypothetical protein EON66_04595 [archaeon]
MQQRLLATMHNSTVRAAEWIEKWSVQHWSSFLDGTCRLQLPKTQSNRAWLLCTSCIIADSPVWI